MAMGSCGVLCGPEWHCNNSSSSSVLKPEASPCQLPRLSHGVSPAEGKLRESGSQLPASCRQNCITASSGFPQSLQREHIQLPRKREGERDTEEKRETFISCLGWEALGFELPLISWVGKINTDPLEIIQVTKMNPWARALPGRDTSRKALGWSSVERKGRSQAGERPWISISLSCVLYFGCHSSF